MITIRRNANWIEHLVVTVNFHRLPFQVDKRGEQHRQKWQETVEAEEQKRREAAKFKARPAIVLHKEPFQPHPSDKPLSDIMNFELHSDRRAVEREAYERQKKQREADLDAMKRQVDRVINVDGSNEIYVYCTYTLGKKMSAGPTCYRGLIYYLGELNPIT